MPFTVSHVAAVLPAYRVLSRAQVFTAAVIGSMVPDFGFLLPGALSRLQTHSVAALFTFCLPVGLLAYLLTVLLIRPAIIEILPDRAFARVRAALSVPVPQSLRHILLVLLAILLGAITHLIWDAFTHENARGVRMFPVLEAYTPELDGHSLRLYHLLQYGSSVVGLLAVILALVLWVRHAPRPAQPLRRSLRSVERWVWTLVYLALPWLGMGVSFAHVLQPSLAWMPTGLRLGTIAIAGMRTCALTLVVLSVLLRVRLGLIRTASSA